jgi:hypothetical protein
MVRKKEEEIKEKRGFKMNEHTIFIYYVIPILLVVSMNILEFIIRKEDIIKLFNDGGKGSLIGASCLFLTMIPIVNMFMVLLYLWAFVKLDSRN